MDSNYWEAYYSKQVTEDSPSLFAQDVLKILGDRKSIVELGCGNGRDAVFFASNGYLTEAVDQCAGEIAFLKSKFKESDNLTFKCADFTQLADGKGYDTVYSRFTLHSVTKEQERRVLAWSHRNLNAGGLLCIEARGKKNEIHAFGHPVEGEQDAYVYDDHYRRFLDFDVLCKDLSDLGFALQFAAEEKGFAPYKGQNETYIRVIARK